MTGSYSADRIQVLKGHEAVRKRPGMYIGSIGPRGLHHLVYEVADNSINEALAGYCTRIEVDLNADGSVTVTDNDRGIPTKINSKTGKSFLEEVLTVLCAGYRAGDSYKVAGGIRGVGIGVVNALSQWLQVTVWREGQIYSQRFDKGVAVTPLTAKLGRSRSGRSRFATQLRSRDKREQFGDTRRGTKQLLASADNGAIVLLDFSANSPATKCQ